MRAVIYARYSSDRQREESIEGQLRECRKYAEYNNISVVGEYIDRAQSGRSDQRENFQRMIQDSSKQLWEVIIVYKLDRFSRNRYDSAIYKKELSKYGVRVLSAMEQIGTNAESIILEGLLESYAEYYSLELAQKTKRGKIDTALKCKHNGGRPLLGYKVNADQTYSIDEDGATAVRLIFDMYANGNSYNDIIDTLNVRGFRTGKGSTFGKNSLHDLFRNERYIGIFVYNRSKTINGKRNNHANESGKDLIKIQGGIPAIIDINTWEKVQRRIQANKKAPGRNKANVNYMLTGKIFCGKCGSAMVGYPSTSKSGVYHYYSCSGKKRLRNCDKSNIKKDWIEDFVIDKTVALMGTVDLTNIADRIITAQLDTSEQDRELARLRKLYKETIKGIENLVAAIEQGIFSPTTKSRLDELESQKLELERQIVQLDFDTKIIISREMIIEWLEQFSKMDKHDAIAKQKIIDYLIRSVHVYEDRVVILYNYRDPNGEDTKATFEDIEKCADFDGDAPSAPFP